MGDGSVEARSLSAPAPRRTCPVCWRAVSPSRHHRRSSRDLQRTTAHRRVGCRELPVAPEDDGGYDRDRFFGGWIDADRDCQSARPTERDALMRHADRCPNNALTVPRA
jgi:hypothetical protein